MRTLLLTITLALAWGAPIAVPALAVDAVASTTSPPQVAKAPDPAPPKAPEVKPVIPISATTAGNFQIAQLTYPVPPSSSAAILLQAADDYAYYTDWVNYKIYLQNVVASYPGTPEAGRALALLADQFTSENNTAQADAATTALAEYTDPEVQAFAALVHTAYPARRAKQYDVAEQAYLAYLQQYHGTASGGWAALRLGDLYRFGSEEYEKAITLFQQIITDYSGTPIAEEALVSMAETYNWSESGRNVEANAAYVQALNTAQTPGIQVRALFGLGDILSASGEHGLAMQVFTQLINAYPTHPSAALAYSMRSIAAEARGDWDTAVADIRAYLTYPAGGQFMKARAHWLFAKDAFKKGNVAEAEAEFTLLAQLAEESRHTVEFKGEARAGLAGCAIERGDLRGALQYYLQAADVEYYQNKKAAYLSQAAGLAQQLNDTATRNQIIARMSMKFSGILLLSSQCEQMGDYLGARKWFLRAAELAPNREVSLWQSYRAAWCLLRLERMDEAAPEYQAILMQPDLPPHVAQRCRTELAFCQTKDPDERLLLRVQDLDAKQ